MAGSVSTEVWLDRRRWDALEEALKARADRQRYLEQLAWRLHDDD